MGNNIPFEPGDASAYKKGNAPIQKFSGKHRVPQDKRTTQLASKYPNGNASGGGQPNNMAVIQKAAGRRLFGGKSGAFAANYSRNT